MNGPPVHYCSECDCYPCAAGCPTRTIEQLPDWEAIAKRFEQAALDNETAAKAAQQQATEAKAEVERVIDQQLRLREATNRTAQAEGRREGLEEAAKIAEGSTAINGRRWDHCGLAMDIRALLESQTPSPKEP